MEHIHEHKHDFLLFQYNNLRAEMLQTIENQFKLLTTLVTVSATILIYLATIKTQISAKICGCVILPSLYSFFGILWLDQVYRQKRLGVFIYGIEKKLEEFGGWEHFIIDSKKTKKRNSKVITNRFYYYAFVVMFFVVPIVSFAYGCSYAGKIKLFWSSPLLGVVAFASYIIVGILYIKELYSFRNTDNYLSNLESKERDANMNRSKK